jgi:hypothetical protein
VDVHLFDDLHAHPSLIMKGGHIEQGGEVVTTARASESEGMPGTPWPGDRAERDGAVPASRPPIGN